MPQVPHLNRFYPAIPLKELTSFYSVGNQAFSTTPASGNIPALTHRAAILSYLPKTLLLFDEFKYSNHYVLLLENLTQVNSISWEFQLYLNGMKKNNGSFLKAVDTNPFEYIIYFQGSITENNGQPKFDRLDITCTVVNGSETLTLKLTHDFAKATGVTHLVSGSQTLPFAGDPLTYNFIANQLKEYLPNKQKEITSLEVLKWNNQVIEIAHTENEALLFTVLGVLYYNIQTSKAMNGELTRSFDWKDFSQSALIESIETDTPYKGNFKIGLGMLPLHILSDAMPVNVNAIPDFANIAINHPLFAILSASGAIVYNEVAVETQHIVPPLLQQSKDRLLANQARLITLYHYAQFPKSAIRMVAVLIKFLFECSQKNNCNECKKRTVAFTTATLTKLKEIPNLANNILTHYYREPYNKIKKFAPQAVKVADLTRSPYAYSLVHNVPPRILKAYFAKRIAHKVSDDYYELDFERVDSEMFTDASRILKDVNGVNRLDALGNPLRKPDWDNFLGRETYLVVETWGCKGRTVRCNLSLTPAVFAAGTNGGNLIVQVGNAFSSDIDKSLNQYDALFTNANALPGNNLALVTEYLEVNHSGKAIIRLRLRPDTVPDYDTWTANLGNNRTSLSITARLTSNEACFFGNEIRQTAPNGRFLHATDKYNNSCQYQLENRIVYEIHHAGDLWNRLSNNVRLGRINNQFVENIENTNTALLPFRRIYYFYYDELGHEHSISDCKLLKPKKRRNGRVVYLKDDIGASPAVIDAFLNNYPVIGNHFYHRASPNSVVDVSATMQPIQRIANNLGESREKYYASHDGTTSYPPERRDEYDQIIVRGINKNAIVNYEIDPTDLAELRVEIIQMPDLLNFAFTVNNSDKLIRYTFTNTQRRFANPGCFGAFLGILAQLGYDNVTSSGMCFDDATSYPSVTHPNGDSIDTGYLDTQAKRHAIIAAFIEWNFTQVISGSNSMHNGDGAHQHNSRHNDHLHSGNFNDNTVANIIH
jgi:hypothetical protein